MIKRTAALIVPFGFYLINGWHVSVAKIGAIVGIT